MSQKRRVQIPLIQALSWIVGSTLIISGSAHTLFSFFLDPSRQVYKKEVPVITSLIQTGPQKEPLSSEYLAQLMRLSKNRPRVVSRFDPAAAVAVLLSSPLIKQAEVKLIKPSTLYVDYTVRQPVGWVYDYENIGIDKEGFLIPMHPFFPPKNLPEIYLGLSAFGSEPRGIQWPKSEWNHPLESPILQLAFDIMFRMQSVSRDLFRIKRIDVSKAFDLSLGSREVIVVVDNEVFGSSAIPVSCIHYLRLSSDRYSQELGNYLELRSKLIEIDSLRVTSACNTQDKCTHETVIDLRLDQLAYIEEVTRK